MSLVSSANYALDLAELKANRFQLPINVLGQTASKCFA